MTHCSDAAWQPRPAPFEPQASSQLWPAGPNTSSSGGAPGLPAPGGGAAVPKQWWRSELYSFSWTVASEEWRHRMLQVSSGVSESLNRASFAACLRSAQFRVRRGRVGKGGERWGGEGGRTGGRRARR